MVAFAAKTNSAYAGATRLQEIIDFLGEDSILVDLCAADGRSLIKNWIGDSSCVDTGIGNTSMSVMEAPAASSAWLLGPRRCPRMMMR